MPKTPKPDMSTADRDLLLTMIKSRLNDPTYHDKIVVHEATKNNIIGRKVSFLEIARLRSDEGLRKPSKRGRRSLKFKPNLVDKAIARHLVPTQKRRGRPVKTENTSGLASKTVTIDTQVIVTLASLKAQASSLMQSIDQYAAQEKARLEL